jgi:tape measure domain-containing protein
VSSSVDDKVVSIQFDNAQFQKNIAATIGSLDALNQKINSLGSGHGFAAIQSAANSLNLSSIAEGVDKISGRFDALGAIGFSAIQKITQGFMGFVANFARQDILGPLITGGKERATNIEQAQFQFRGLGMDVQAVMQDALSAVKGTAYGLGDAAKAAAQFGASGITAGADMSQSLRAIAGTAAMTSTNFSDMAYLFTTSAAMGKVTNMDFQQFATRGLNAAAAYGKQMNLTEAQVHDLASKGQISYKEFAAAMDAAFGAHATAANETYTGSLANLHAAMSRIGASFFGPQMDQQRDLFNALIPVIDNVNTALQPLINSFLWIGGSLTKGMIASLNNINLSSLTPIFEALGNSLTNVFYFLKQIGSVAKSAWNDIFPASLGVSILLIAQGIERFTASLQLGGQAASQVKSIFQGFFSILDIAWAVLKGVASVIVDVIKALLPVGSGFLSTAASVGDFLTKLDEMLVKSGKIHDFFENLGRIIVVPATAISEFVKKIIEFFSTKPSDSGMTTAFDNISKHIQSLGDFWDRLVQRFSGVFNVFGKIWDYISNWFSDLGQKIADALQPDSFNAVADVLNAGLLGAIALMLKNFTTGGLKVGLGGGVFGVIQSNLIAVTRTLNQMQAKIQADTIFKIAAAIGILAISMVTLAGVDSTKLTKALTAMAVGFTELVAVMKILQVGIGSFSSAASLVAISVGMIAAGIAIGVLSLAIKNLSTMDWQGLAKGLTGVGIGLGLLVAASKLLAGSTSGMIAAGLGMIAMSAGLLILSQAVEAFSKLSWEGIGKGLASIAAGLGLLTAAMKLMPASSVISGAGFIEMTIGLRILADVVQEFGKLSWDSIAKGLLGIAGGLLAITAAVNFMPVTLPITAAGFVILAVGLRILGDAMEKIGSLSLEEIGKSLLGLAGAMIILVPAMNAMQASIGGAVAMAVISGSLVLLGDVMEKLGKLGITQIVTSLGAIAAVLILLGLASAVLEPVVPAMLALGLALGILGGAFSLFGLGAMLVAESFQIMAVAGVAGTAALLQSLKMMMKALPELAAAAALFVVSFVDEILKAMPTFIKLFTAFLEQVLLTVIKEVPLIAMALATVIDHACALLITKGPLLIETAMILLLDFMQSLSDNIYPIIQVGTQIIVNLVKGLVDNMPQLVQSAVDLIISFTTELGNHAEELTGAGANLLIQFLLGIASNVGSIVAAVANIITTFLGEIGNHTLEIMNAGVNLVLTMVYGVSQAIGNIVGAVTSLIVTFLNTLGSHAVDIINAGVNLIITLIQGIANAAIQFVNAAGQTIVSFLNALTLAINTYAPQIRAAGLRLVLAIIQGVTGADLSAIIGWCQSLGSKFVSWVGNIGDQTWHIGEEIVHGIWNGISKMGSWLLDKLRSWASGIVNSVLGFFGIHSPSTVFAEIGTHIPEGLVLGISKASHLATESMSMLASDMSDSFNIDPKDMTSILSKLVASFNDMDEFNPVITPVLDLTKVQSAASGIAGYLKDSPITADLSIQQARIISTTADIGTDATSTPPPTAPTSVSFEQTINAPTALSTNEIYRNTRNQITLAKEELDIL